MRYKICYDIFNPITKKTKTITMTSALDSATAYEVLREYESQEMNTEFYLEEVKE